MANPLWNLFPVTSLDPCHNFYCFVYLSEKQVGPQGWTFEINYLWFIAKINDACHAKSGIASDETGCLSQ